MDEKRKALIDGLREVAAFLENNERAPTPLPPQLNAFLYSKEDFTMAAKAIGGKLDKKNDYGQLMVLRKEFGPISYDLNCDRELICERVVTGKRIVPTVEAIPEHEEEVVEWKCGTVLI